jgi:alkanesulfonate monooxygenase SsuD/methylene tetrahydromethanopterin reductase-like flavin-dependent oxidoreductase (luciferase family)
MKSGAAVPHYAALHAGYDRGFIMQFGILFTSQPNVDTEPYPHRDVHARVTRQILRADELGYDYAWIAEHHFSNEYGIMPDVFVYAAYLAALTRRIKIGTAVVTLPLANPRVRFSQV